MQPSLSELRVNCISEIQNTTFAFQLTKLANSIKIAKSLRPRFWNHMQNINFSNSQFQTQVIYKIPNNK
jgi:hypothetical protein